jgi:hypothetical protein
MDVVLTDRALNRATLARQLLLDRVDRPALEVVRHLVGMQGQDAELPYIGLWNRIPAFRHDDLSRLLHTREVVRGTLFRGTQHLLAADDYVWVRPLLQPMLNTRQRGWFGRHLAGVDPAASGWPDRRRLSCPSCTRRRTGCGAGTALRRSCSPRCTSAARWWNARSRS